VTSAEAGGSYLAKTYPQRHVVGSGANAYIQLSGTSMAAGIVSGTVALMLEQRPGLGVRQMKFALQLTSSLMLSEGLVASGAGTVNAQGARRFLAKSLTARTLPETEIASETIRPAGIAFTGRVTPQLIRRVVSANFAARSTRTLQAKNVAHSNDVLAVSEVAHWSSSENDTIFWGTDNTIFGAADDTIFWGTDNTIFGAADDTIFWGTDNTIFGAADDTIFWGTNNTIFGAAHDTIFWGTGDTIYWGTAHTIDSATVRMLQDTRRSVRSP
jgi:subtilisin family serine protease